MKAYDQLFLSNYSQINKKYKGAEYFKLIQLLVQPSLSAQIKFHTGL